MESVKELLVLAIATTSGVAMSYVVWRIGKLIESI